MVLEGTRRRTRTTARDREERDEANTSRPTNCKKGATQACQSDGMKRGFTPGSLGQGDVDRLGVFFVELLMKKLDEFVKRTF